MKKASILIIITLLISIISIFYLGKNPEISNKHSEEVNLNEYRTLYTGEIRTLNYLVSSNTMEISLISNLIDPLIEYDMYGVIRPAIAKEWKVSDDKLVWTFHIKEGLYWYKSDGSKYAELVAEDFLTSLEYILNSENESMTANIAYKIIKNAEKYYKGEIINFDKVGVKAIDRYTLEYTLEKPAPYFLSLLTYTCFLPVNKNFIEEQGGRFGTDKTSILYCGPYLLESFEPQNRRILIKNTDYWDKDRVFINRVISTYNKEALSLAPEMFLRNEIDAAPIASNILKEWIEDPQKEKMLRTRRDGYYSFFYALNFDPKFSKEYEPDNWKQAVNNYNFRKALFHGIDKKSAKLVSEPFEPEKNLLNTITPKNFIDYKGIDYTLLGNLGEISGVDTFNEKLAKKYKELAVKELKNNVTFPVKVLMPYNSASKDWANRSQVIKQQIEKLLGKDFINIIVKPHPPTGFLQKVRRNGSFALLECNWGPDFADPETYADPFIPLSSFNKPYLAEGYEKNGMNEYYSLVLKAKEEYEDIEKRYILFAKAEAFLINQALVIPYSSGGSGYLASRLDPFLASYSPYGNTSERYKGQKLLNKPMDRKEFQKALKEWEYERRVILNNLN